MGRFFGTLLSSTLLILSVALSACSQQSDSATARDNDIDVRLPNQAVINQFCESMARISKDSREPLVRSKMREIFEENSINNLEEYYGDFKVANTLGNLHAATSGVDQAAQDFARGAYNQSRVDHGAAESAYIVGCVNFLEEQAPKWSSKSQTSAVANDPLAQAVNPENSVR